MADKKLESITFPDLPDRYVVKPDIADVTGLQTALNGKADAEDVYNGFVSETLQGSIASFDDGADDIPVKSLVADIVPLQSGSGDPSPDNVRAISGWNGCNVYVAKVYANMLDLNDADNGYLYNKYLTSSGTETNFGGYAVTEYIKVSAGDSVTIKPGSANSPSVCFYNASKSFVSGANYGYSNPFTTTVPSGAEYMRCSYEYNYASPYVEVEKTTHTISFASAGTVYGGSIDVTTGVLTVDKVIKDLGTLPWTKYTQAGPVGYYFGCSSGNINPTPKASAGDLVLPDIMCSALKPESSAHVYSTQMDLTIGIHTNSAIVVCDSDYTVASDFKTAMDGVMFVYPLATPQTYQLTPTEVKTLLGNNNVWADTGDIDLTYRADLGLYLDKIINA